MHYGRFYIVLSLGRLTYFQLKILLTFNNDDFFQMLRIKLENIYSEK